MNANPEMATQRKTSGIQKVWWLGALAVCIAVSIPQALHPNVDAEISDALAEKLTGWAALHGDAYTPIPDIAEDYGLQVETWDHLHPRPPAALLLQTPLVLISDRWLLTVVGVLTATSLVSIFWVAWHLLGGPVWPWFGAATLLSITWLEYRRGNLWMVLAGALLAIGWRFADRVWGRALLGLVAAVKLWPFVVLAGMWRTTKYRSAAVQSVIWAFAITSLGLLLPGVDLSGAQESLSGIRFVDTLANWTIAGLLARRGVPWAVLLGAVTAGIIWIWATRSNRGDRVVSWSIILGLAASPIAWPPYWLAAVPAAAALIRESVANKGFRHPIRSVPDETSVKKRRNEN